MTDVFSNLDPFLEDLKSSQPTPGGGAVAGLTGALAAALTHMVASLTVGKKKYADVAEDFAGAMPDMDAMIQEFRGLIEDDVEAFQGFMAALRLPKDSDDEKTLRSGALRTATLQAAEVPMRTIRATERLLPLIRLAAEKGNTNAVSDAGCAALLVTTTVRSAALNVKINLSGRTGGEFEEIARELEQLLPNILKEAGALADLVESRL